MLMVSLPNESLPQRKVFEQLTDYGFRDDTLSILGAIEHGPVVKIVAADQLWIRFASLGAAI